MKTKPNRKPCPPARLVTLADLQAAQVKILRAIRGVLEEEDKNILADILSRSQARTRRLERLNARTPKV